MTCVYECVISGSIKKKSRSGAREGTQAFRMRSGVRISMAKKKREGEGHDSKAWVGKKQPENKEKSDGMKGRYARLQPVERWKKVKGTT